MLITCRRVAAPLICVLVVASLAPVAVQGADELTGRVIGSLALGTFDTRATRGIAWDPEGRRVFSANGAARTLDIIDLADPTAPTLAAQVEVGGAPSSVAVNGDLVAVAVPGPGPADPGRVAFLATDGSEVGSVDVGVGPTMVAFTPRGSKVLTADEGRPSDDYAVDPEGTVTIIDLAAGPATATAVSVGFADFDTDGPRASELDASVRIIGPGASVAQDFEPESLAISPDGATAYVSLQENDAVAVIDVTSASVQGIVALRSSDLGFTGIDPSSTDGGINIAPWPVLGMFQPDGLAVLEVGERRYLVTANEGALRDLPGFSEVAHVRDLVLDEDVFLDASIIQNDENAGGLVVSDQSGDLDGDGDFDLLFAAGSRSFSVWDTTDWQPAFDSADEMEQHVAETNPAHFNSAADAQPSFDTQSPLSGPAPAAVTLGRIGNRTYAFIGLAQQGGVMVYDITRPKKASFVTYLENRFWSGDPATGTAGDLGPADLVFVEAAQSPNGRDLLLVANEVSAGLTVWELAQP